MRAPDTAHAEFERITRLLKNPAVHGVIDQIDRSVRVLLTSTLHGGGDDLPTGPERLLFAAEAWIRQRFREDIDLSSLASRFGFSEPTFRHSGNARHHMEGSCLESFYCRIETQSSSWSLRA